jgi:hypothetical protein
MPDLVDRSRNRLALLPTSVRSNDEGENGDDF